MGFNWGSEINCPVKGRELKPRTKGLTMVLDKGLGLENLSDLLALGGKYIDLLKLSFGSSFLYPPEILSKKIRLVKQHDIHIFPGGTLFEVAYLQQKSKEYFNKARELGFTAVEISSGTIDFTASERKKMINQARTQGLLVLTEVGKKNNEKAITVDEFINLIQADFYNGSRYIIIEGRESGKGVSIYEDNGDIDQVKVDIILNSLNEEIESLIWETPLKKQQLYFLDKIGFNVNLGNIAPHNILALESLRQGLRGDTLQWM